MTHCPSIESIIKAVCREFSLPETELLSHRRKVVAINPRHVLMYLSWYLTTNSFPKIAAAIDRNPTTVADGVERIQEQLPRIPELKARIDKLVAELRTP